MDGRDIGTVVLPSADIKVFLTADLATRVYRRQQELSSRGFYLPTSKVRAEMCSETRRFKPPGCTLKPTDDAYVLDTTDLTPEEVFKQLSGWLDGGNMKEIIMGEQALIYTLSAIVVSYLRIFRRLKVVEKEKRTY